MLIRQLPRESATVREVEGEAVRWGDQEHLLASILEALWGANWQRANTGSKRPSPQPERLQRPGDQPKKLKLSGGELRRRLEEQRRRVQH